MVLFTIYNEPLSACLQAREASPAEQGSNSSVSGDVRLSKHPNMPAHLLHCKDFRGIKLLWLCFPESLLTNNWTTGPMALQKKKFFNS